MITQIGSWASSGYPYKKMASNWRQSVVDECKTWLGTPYVHKGRVRGVGVDCGGLLYEVYGRFFGPLKPYPKDYPPDWTLHKENEIYLDFLEGYVFPVSKPAVGGITMWKFGRNFAHGTIYIGDNTWIHAFGRNGSGVVQKSRRSFFTAERGRLRDHRHFDLDETWLLPHH